MAVAQEAAASENFLSKKREFPVWQCRPPVLASAVLTLVHRSESEAGAWWVVFPKKSSPIRGWFPVVEIGISCQVRAADLKGGGLRYARSPSTAGPDVFLHAQNEEFETEFTITRTITEDARHQFIENFQAYLPAGSINVRSAIDYLLRVHSQEYFNFIANCWRSAQINLPSNFPMVFPPS